MNYASQIVQPAQWQPPINLDLLMKGSMYQRQEQDRAVQNTNAQLDHLYNLPTLPGADTEIKKQLLSKLTESINGISTADLNNPNIQNQLKQNVNQLTSNPDFQTVVKRGAQYQQNMKKYTELTANGEQLAPENMEPIRKAQEYIQKGVYIRNANLDGDIYANADMAKFWKSVNEAYKARTGIDPITLGTGQYTQEVEEKNIEGLKKLAESMMSGNPQVQGQIQRGMKMHFENTNFEQNAVQEASSGIEQARTIIAQANHVLATPNSSPKARKDAALALQWAQQSIQENSKQIQSPNGAFQRQKEEKDYLDRIIGDNMQGYAYHNTKNQKMDEGYKMSRELNNHIYEHQANKLYDEVAEGALALGQDPATVIANRNTKEGMEAVQSAINKKQELALQLAQAKSDIALQAKEDFQDYKENPTTAAKAWSVLKSTGEGDFVSIIPSLKSGNWGSDGAVEDISLTKAKTYSNFLARKLGVNADLPIKSIKQDDKDKTKLNIEFETGFGHFNITKPIDGTEFVNLITDKELGKLGYNVSGASSKDGSLTVTKTEGSTGPTGVVDNSGVEGPTGISTEQNITYTSPTGESFSIPSSDTAAISWAIKNGYKKQ